MSSFFYEDSDAPRPNRSRRVGVVALIESDGRLLLERRADAPVWGLIGGALEHDETLLDALRREVQEETGLAITTYDLFGTFSDPSRVVRYRDGNIFQLVTLVYRVEVEDIAAMSVSSDRSSYVFSRGTSSRWTTSQPSRGRLSRATWAKALRRSLTESEIGADLTVTTRRGAQSAPQKST